MALSPPARLAVPKNSIDTAVVALSDNTSPLMRVTFTRSLPSRLLLQLYTTILCLLSSVSSLLLSSISSLLLCLISSLLSSPLFSRELFLDEIRRDYTIVIKRKLLMTLVRYVGQSWSHEYLHILFKDRDIKWSQKTGQFSHYSGIISWHPHSSSLSK